MTDSRARGRSFWISLPVGWAVMAFGLWSLYQNRAMTDPLYTFALAFGTNVAHDAVLAPTACLVAFAVSRLLRPPYRSVANWALFTTVVMLLVAYAPLRGFGRYPDNPSVLPLNYATALATVLAVVWGIAGALALLLYARRVRRKGSAT